ncbi:ImmA/IrrE family metallo-endopeptidase [Paenibacillus ginsengarvi]|uniref:ImmA/IrrE family metallo-endopeptidase n=1 Tax=Paenibacillus ginsengarvi TaxID=400777 RepID=A0A3B0BRT6_9BACL|nr:ImmA/IrrE family metallo-endopeptidase [Paenibacillus ginsengarvi]RKN75048.1 ImmA/IrrE family metallo-endopeptidase [Paenibacillus ginsengarvi]
MAPYDLLIEQALGYGLVVKEKTFLSNAKGLIKGSKIGISKEMSTVEKACTLAEEIAHYLLSVGNILDQTDIRNRKQELIARQWAYQCMIPLDRIVQAYKKRITGRYDLAEFLGVTEEFLQNAIDRYTSKYGIYVNVDEQYTIRFDPLGVVEMFP